MKPLHLAAVGAAFMALSVGLGAFGAHGLRGSLSPESLASWETAARYLAYHGLGLFAVAFVRERVPARCTAIAGGLLIGGTLLFSGSLFAYALTGERSFGMVAPIGGTSLMAGWITLTVSAFLGCKAPPA